MSLLPGPFAHNSKIVSDNSFFESPNPLRLALVTLPQHESLEFFLTQVHVGQGCKVEEKVRRTLVGFKNAFWLSLWRINLCFSGANHQLHHYGQCDGGNGVCASGSKSVSNVDFTKSLSFTQYWHYPLSAGLHHMRWEQCERKCQKLHCRPRPGGSNLATNSAELVCM